MHPSPKGGVVVLVREKPDGQTDEDHLIAVDGQGNQLWDKTLRTSDATNRFDPYQAGMSVDVYGQVLVWQNYAAANLTGPSFHHMLVQLRYGATGEVRQSFTTESLNHDTNYLLSYGTSPALSEGRAYVALMQCDSLPCNAYSPVSVHALSFPELGMDYPRGALLGTTRSKVTYVALGDSFSSGEGAPMVADGTDVGSGPNKNMCHRSVNAYSGVLSAQFTLGLNQVAFVACSGAKTAQITGKWPAGKGNADESPQQAALNSSTDVFTLTIGGNDADFDGLAARCVLIDCTTYRDQYIGNIDKPEFRQALSDTYDAILAATPNAKIYVGGYPQVFPTEGCTQPDVWMKVLDGVAKAALSPDPLVGGKAKDALTKIGQDNNFNDAEIAELLTAGKIEFNANEGQLIRDFTLDLDKTIQSVVESKDPTHARMVYVDPLAPDSPFWGHQLCSATPYFHGLDPISGGGFNNTFAFHPTGDGNITSDTGQSAYARLFMSYMTGNKGAENALPGFGS